MKGRKKLPKGEKKKPIRVFVKERHHKKAKKLILSILKNMEHA